MDEQLLFEIDDRGKCVLILPRGEIGLYFFFNLTEALSLYKRFDYAGKIDSLIRAVYVSFDIYWKHNTAFVW